MHDDANVRTLLAWRADCAKLPFHARMAKRIDGHATKMPYIMPTIVARILRTGGSRPHKRGACNGEKMTSEERREARYFRRRIRREVKRLEHKQPFDTLTAVTDMNKLRMGASLSRKGVGKKASVQKYFINELQNETVTRNKILRGEDIREGFIEFDLRERGHARHIRAMHFRERVVQRAICDFALVPVLTRSLVHDNGASLKGKGIHFAIYRVRDMLRRYYRKHGSFGGYVLQVDFSRYFDNIDHGEVWRMLDTHFDCDELKALAWKFVQAFGEKGIGIGSQVSQIIAVAYPNRADHWLKERARIGTSCRYMDDTMAIHEDRARLQAAFDGLCALWERLGIVVNRKKTRIIPLQKFTFLKVRYQCLPSGRVLMKPCRQSFVRMRRHLRSFKRFWERGEMTIRQVLCAYQSWYGYQQHFNCHKALREMDKYFFSLFGVWMKHEKRHKNKVYERGNYKWLKRQLASARTRRIVLPACA